MKNGELVAARGTDLAILGVRPHESWRRLPSAIDFPVRRPVGPHRLGTGLTLVDRGFH